MNSRPHPKVRSRARVGTRSVSLFAPAPVAAAVAIALMSLDEAAVRSASAAPAGGEVAAGAATIQQSGASTVINQSSNRAALNWQSFSIGAAESVIFRQPSSSAVALNRVVGPNPSAIYGSLQANGHVFLVNPSGVLFGRGAQVDVAGLVASTLNITNNDFMAGRYVFTGGAGSGAVVNEGTLRAANGGYVALIGNQVTNTGTIVAANGSVALGAGDAVTLDFNGDGLVNLKVNAAAIGAQIRHGGLIQADGGRVIMSAQAKNALLDTVLNVDGIVVARDAVERAGEIYLDGGRSGATIVSGLLDASSVNAGKKGGEIRVLGEYVALASGAKLDASGPAGGGTVLVGGDFQGKNPDIPNATRTVVATNATINADATDSGDGGKVIVWADDWTRFYGTISAKGGQAGGNGGFAEVSGKATLDFNGRADLGAPRGVTGTLYLDPQILDITDAGGNSDVNVIDGTINFADPPASASVSVSAINNSSGANVSLNAGQIRFQNTSSISRSGNLSFNTNSGIAGGGNDSIMNVGPGILGPQPFSITTSGGGTISFTTAGTGVVDLTNITLNSGSTVTVNAGGAVTLGRINAGAVNATAASGALTLTQNVAATVNGNIDLSPGTGNVDLRATTGDIAINGGTISSGTGTLQLIAGGAITTNTTTGTTTELSTGGGTRLQAGAPIGSSTNRIETAVGTLAATAQGNIFINELDALTVGAVGAINAGPDFSGITTTANNGSIRLVAGGTITVTSPIAANGSGNVAVQATGSSSDININGTTVSSGTGSLQARAGRHILTDTPTGTANEFTTAGGGTLLLDAGDSIGTSANRIDTAVPTLAAVSAGLTTAGDIFINQTTGALGIALASGQDGRASLSGITTQANNNDITVVSAGTLNVNANVTAHGSGNVALQTTGAGSDIVVGEFGAATVASTSGNLQARSSRHIAGTTGGTTQFGTGGSGTLLLDAQDAIGASSQRVRTAVPTVAAVSAGSTTAGDIFITQGTGPLMIGTATGLDGRANLSGITTQANNNQIAVTAPATLTISQNVSANGSGTVDLRTTGGSSDIAFNGGIASSGSGTLQLIAGGAITTNTLTGATTELSTGGGARLQAGTRIGSTTNRIDTSIATLSATASGSIFINEATGVSVGVVAPINGAPAFASNGITTTGGGSIVLVTGGAMTISQNVTTTADGNITLVSRGALSVNENVTAGGSGNVALQTTGENNDIRVGIDTGARTVSSATGNIQVRSSGGILGTTGGTNQFATSGAGTLLLDAVNGIGASDRSVKVAVPTLAAIATGTIPEPPDNANGPPKILANGNANINIAQTAGPLTIGTAIGLNGRANLAGVSLTGAGGAITITSPSTLAVNAAITSEANPVTLTGTSVTSNAAGTITTSGTANGGNAPGIVTITATTGPINLAGAINTSAAANPGNGFAGGNVILTTPSSITVSGVNMTGGPAGGVAGGINGGNSGQITFNGGAGLPIGLNGALIARGGDAVGAGTGGNGAPQVFNVPLLIGGAASIDTRGGSGAPPGSDGIVTLGTIDGAAASGDQTLSVFSGSAATTLQGDVGASQPLGGFIVAAGSIVFAGPGPARTINASAGAGGATVAFNGPITLANNLIVNTDGANDNNVRFGSTINADDNTLVDRTLTVTAGTGAVTFDANVGAGANGALAGLDVTGGTINLNAPTFNVNDSGSPQTTVRFNGPTVLGANVNINAHKTTGTDNNVSFTSTINGASALAVSSSGTTTFGGAIGGTTPLASLTTDAGGTTAINGGVVKTSGNQLFGDSVVVGANTALTSSAGNITFTNALGAGAAALTLGINAPVGTVTFSGNVGVGQPFADFDVTAGPNTIIFNGAAAQIVNVNAGGGNTVSFNGPVLLLQDVTINAGGATSNNVAFNGTVNAGASGTRTFVVDAGTGTVLFELVGNVAQLAALTASGGTVTFDANAIATQIAINANSLFTSANGVITATLPFTSYNGPAALTLSGPASGGTYGSQADALRVDVPGLLVVLPNGSRALPVVWLRGDPAKKPFYQFYDDASRREVCYNAECGAATRSLFETDPYNPWRLERVRFASQLAELDATAGAALAAELERDVARKPDQCTSATVDPKSGLQCDLSK